MGRKKPQIPEPEVFHVEVITKARVNDDLKWEYLVKWAGYSSDADSWEPEENVRECTRLLKSFWTHIGLDDEDYESGYLVEAKPEWISEERQYFAKEYTQQQQMEENHQRPGENKAREKPKKTLNKDQTRSSTVSKAKEKKPVKNLVSDSDSDTLPLAIRIPRKRPAPILDDVPTKYSEKKVKTGSFSTSIGSTMPSAKGKQKQISPDSPTSLFSGPSSPELPLGSSLPSITPAQSGSGPSKTASTHYVPNHQERQTNPRIKLLPLEPRQVASGSGLSTKQRLAQSTVVAASTKPKISSPRNSLMSLSFKKKPPPPSGNSRVDKVDETKPLVLQETASPVESRFFSGDGPEIPASPKSMTSQDYIPLMEHDPFDSFLPLPDADVHGPLQLDSQNHLSQAERFLQTVMPNELAVPLMETVETIPDPIPPRAFAPIKSSSLPKIQKKWKWSGRLLMNTSRDKLERLCDVALTDATEHLPEGLRLSVVFSSMDSIRFSKLHDASDVDIILRACKPVHQVAKLGPQDEKDADALKTLVRYMGKRRQVTFAPLLLDNAIVGILLVFPATMDDLCRRFKAPAHLQQNGVLISALLPWTLPTAKRKEESRKPHYADNATASSILDSNQREITLRRFPAYHRAIYSLQFPKWLYDYMSQPGRPYCVWWTPADGTSQEPGIETKLLLSILKQFRAKNVGHKSDVRAVFVHVGALKSLHKLPALVERRSKRPEIQFFTYGTHENVSPDQWGIRGIFTMGGIVTFTASVLVEDPIGVCQLISQVAKHPLWRCYILPATMGMVAKLTCAGVDPLIIHDKGQFFYDIILTLIEQGEVSLIRAPPTRRAPLRDEDPIFVWVGRQVRQRELDSRGLLEKCLKDFDEQCSNIQESEWSSAIETEISNDMLNMQYQPSLIDRFRRYVVIKAASDNHILWDRSGLEWLPLSKFDFKDDFFRKELP